MTHKAGYVLLAVNGGFGSSILHAETAGKQNSGSASEDGEVFTASIVRGLYRTPIQWPKVAQPGFDVQSLASF